MLSDETRGVKTIGRNGRRRNVRASPGEPDPGSAKKVLIKERHRVTLACFELELAADFLLLFAAGGFDHQIRPNLQPGTIIGIKGECEFARSRRFEITHPDDREVILPYARQRFAHPPIEIDHRIEPDLNWSLDVGVRKIVTEEPEAVALRLVRWSGRLWIERHARDFGARDRRDFNLIRNLDGVVGEGKLTLTLLAIASLDSAGTGGRK